MGSEAEAGEKQSSIPKLPLFSVLPMQSPERSGMLTPPLHTSASVPFRWEQEPGKPRPCTALVTFSNNNPIDKCLELPPRLLIEAKLTKLPSPTTVLEGPYMGSGSGSNRFRSPSFSSERGLLGAMILAKGGEIREKGWFGSWRKKVKRDVSGDSHVFPSSADRDNDITGTIGVGGSHNKVKMSKMKRSGSFSSLSNGKSRIWSTIRESLKQVFPWRSEKLKKNGSGLGHHR